jgi:hypothetical protein
MFQEGKGDGTQLLSSLRCDNNNVPYFSVYKTLPCIRRNPNVKEIFKYKTKHRIN